MSFVYVLAGIFIFGFLVAIHELGHFFIEDITLHQAVLPFQGEPLGESGHLVHVKAGSRA